MRLAAVTLDTYTHRARLVPALLMLLPGLLTVMLLYPGAYSGLGPTVTSVALACGVLWFLANVVRARGRFVEQRIVKASDGLPTTQMLRHRDIFVEEKTKDRYHRFLAAHVPGLRLPTAEQERLDPAAADVVYRSGVGWLLEFTRDRSRFPLVFIENTSYGFRRNLYGVKPIGLSLTAICIAVLVWSIVRARPATISEISPSQLALSILLFVIGACWVFVVTEAWVTDASRAYAHALLAACDAPTGTLAVHERKIIAP